MSPREAGTLKVHLGPSAMAIGFKEDRLYAGARRSGSGVEQLLGKEQVGGSIPPFGFSSGENGLGRVLPALPVAPG